MHAAVQEDRDALMRVVAMLLALAALAERAGGLSYPVRGLVLWILRPAEAVAREFVADATRTPPPALAEIPGTRCGNRPADAIRLALRFRALAAALGDLMQLVSRFARLMPRIEDVRIHDIGIFLTAAGFAALRVGERKPNDTS